MRAPPPYECKKEITFTVIKDGIEREITVPADRAEQTMPVYGFHFALMSGGGGKIRMGILTPSDAND